MSDLGLIDIGGTSIKLAVMKNQKLEKLPSIPTPKTLEEFYSDLNENVAKMKSEYQIKGVGISSPGAVNKKTGVVEGLQPFLISIILKSNKLCQINLDYL